MDLEQRFLSETIHDDPRTSSPTRRHRSRSPSNSLPQSPINTDDELGSDLDDSGGHTDVIEPTLTRGDGGSAGGAQTGVKGVLRDAKDKKALDGELRKMRMEQTNAQLEARSFQALTVHEEDELRRKDGAASAVKEDEQDIKRWRLQRKQELAARRSGRSDGDESDEDWSATRIGLREIGASGFVSAVERPGWVIVMLYEPDIQRCQSLLRALLRIQALVLTSPATPAPTSNPSNHLSTRPASTLPPLLLKARASSLSFSLLPAVSGTDKASASAADDDAEDADADSGPLRRSDPDVLPTVLAYRDGELAHTWVRVDWDVGEDGAGLEALFKRNGIMPVLTQSKAFGAGQEDEDDYA